MSDGIVGPAPPPSFFTQASTSQKQNDGKAMGGHESDEDDDDLSDDQDESVNSIPASHELILNHGNKTVIAFLSFNNHVSQS